MPIRSLSSAIERRRLRIRSRIKESGRPRLCVHRSLKHIYAQIIDDKAGKTLITVQDSTFKGTKTEKAKQIGSHIGGLALKAGIKEVVFDRGSFAYHGRVKALAEAAREAGLNF